MKQKLRIIATICIAAMLFGIIPSALAYGATSNWAKAELDAMEALGLIPQELEEKEDLRENITRLEMCTIAVQAFEVYIGAEIPVSEEAPFSDTDSPVAAKAYAAGLIRGYEDGTFRPEQLLTREEFFVFVYNFLLVSGWVPEESDFSDLSGFPDAGSVSPWAKSAASLAVGLEIVKGDGQGIAPRATTSCEQALAMFYRTYIVLNGGSPEPGLSFAEKYPNLSNWALVELAPMDRQGLIPEILLGRDMRSDITRREMCYVAVNAYLALRPETSTEVGASPFSDVEDDTITLANSLAIVSGFPDGTFLPDAPITREQFYRITVNFLGALGYNRTDSPATDLSGFQDADQLHEYARPSARLLVSLGILKGDGSGLAPRSSTECQQALALFYRTYNYFLTWEEEQSNPGYRPEAEALVEFALQFEGYPYVWGGASPETGFDCSGLVYYVYRHFGYKVGRTATDQWEYENSWEVSLDELLPGDLVFFSSYGTLDEITHIGIYIGDNQFIHAANSRTGVVIASTESSYFESNCVGARRIIP